MPKLTDRKKYLFKYAFIFMSFLSFIGLIMGLIFLLSNTLEGPSALNYLHRAKCRVTDMYSIPNLCRVVSEDFGIFYQLEWEECLLMGFNITHDSMVDTNCTWIYPQSFPDEKQAIIQIRREYTIGDEYECVLDEINQYCYPDNNVVALEVTVVLLPALSMIFFGVATYMLYYKKNPIELDPTSKPKPKRRYQFQSCIKINEIDDQDNQSSSSYQSQSQKKLSKKRSSKKKDNTVYLRRQDNSSDEVNSISYLNNSNQSDHNVPEEDKFTDVTL